MDANAVSLQELCVQLADRLKARGWTLASAESCTGGLIAAACTSLSGSSDWFERGFITYSNAAKTEMLGVADTLIRSQGAVSEAVALAMARGALACSRARVSVAVTGIAGPTGGSPEKPVGTVWLAWNLAGEVDAVCCHFDGDRDAVRSAAVWHALNGLLQRLSRCEA